MWWASTEHVGGPNQTCAAAARLTVDRLNYQVQASDVGHGTVSSTNGDRIGEAVTPTDRSPTRRRLPPQLLRVRIFCATVMACGCHGWEALSTWSPASCHCQHSENDYFTVTVAASHFEPPNPQPMHPRPPLTRGPERRPRHTPRSCPTMPLNEAADDPSCTRDPHTQPHRGASSTPPHLPEKRIRHTRGCAAREERRRRRLPTALATGAVGGRGRLGDAGKLAASVAAGGRAGSRCAALSLHVGYGRERRGSGGGAPPVGSHQQGAREHVMPLVSAAFPSFHSLFRWVMCGCSHWSSVAVGVRRLPAW